MDMNQGNKAVTRNSRSLAAGMIFLLAVLLASPGTGFSAANVLDPDNSYFFARASYNSVGLESVDYTVINDIDAVPPVVTVAFPADNITFNDIVPVSVNLPVGVEITKVQLYVNGIQVAETAASPYVLSWDTATMVRGDYTVSVRATDAAGNQQVSDGLAVTIAGDTIAPTVSLSAPANNATTSGGVLVSAGADDNFKVARVELYLDGSLVFSSNQASASYTWDSTKETNGGHVLTAKAYDAAGNIGLSTPVAVTVSNDTTPPVVSIGAPANSSTVGGTVRISANASDNIAVTRVEFYVGAALQATSTSAPFGCSWSTAALANGVYILSSKAYDAAGNVGESANVAVNVINATAPTVNSFSMPATANTTAVPVASFTASDNAGVTGYLITESSSVPAASAAGWTSAAPTSFNFSGTGARTAYAWAKDAAGMVSASRAASVLIDTTLPVFSYMSLVSASSNVTIKASATDNIAVSKLQLYVDGILKLESANGSLSYTLSAASGGNNIAVKACDAAGNARSQSFRVYGGAAPPVAVDSSAPSVSLGSPANGSSVGGVVTVSAAATDNTGVSKVEFYLNGVLKSTTASAPYTYSWNTAALANGSYTLSAKAYDAAGNMGQSASVAVSVFNDTVAPSVAIAAPLAGSSVAGIVAVSANCSDDVGVASVQFLVNGALQSTLTSAPYSFSWNTAAFANGSYTLTVNARDAAGNLGTSAVTVSVKNPVPDTTAPVITLVSPVAGAKIAGNVTVSASASDDVAVAKMQLYIDGVLKLETSGNSLVWIWNVKSYSTGTSHVVLVKASDAANNVTSQSVTVYK